METDVTDTLNKEGYFFQKYCAEKIKEAGWIIDFEEYPISDDKTFDIKANLICHETALKIAVVECKRQDPMRKKWIFYRREPVGSKSEPFLIQVHHLHTANGTILRGVSELLAESKLGFPSCHTIGLELLLNKKKRLETNPEVVHSACLTVAKGIKHLFDSEAERLYNNMKLGLKRLESYKKKYGWPYFLGVTLIPVVVTSAPLFSLAFDPNEMDSETFKVPHNEEHYKEEKWLVYEFPLPLETRYRSEHFFAVTGENRYAKMHEFIVNGKYILQFFRCLAESFEVGPEKGWRIFQSEFMDFYEPKKSRISRFWL